MMMTEGIVLGHHISSSGIKVDPAKIQIIENLSEPTTQTDVRFIANFSEIALPLFKLLSKDVNFNWDTDCQYAFKTLK